MKTILVPLGGDIHSENTKNAIRMFFNKQDYRLILLHSVVNEKDDIYTIRTGGLEEEKNQEAIFHHTANALISEGYQVEVSVVSGSVDDNIVNAVKKLSPYMVMMFTGGSTNLIADMLGTNASSIYDDVTCPLMVIPAEFNLRVIKTATVGLSLEEEDPNVLGKYFEYADINKITSSFIKIDSDLQFDIIKDEKILDELNELFPGKMGKVTHRKSKNVADGIEQHAAESNSDLIVIFTTKRNFIEKLFHKSVTKDLVLHSKLPLLIYHY